MNPIPESSHSFSGSWLPGLKRGGQLVGLGGTLLLVGYVSLSNPALGIFGLLVCVSTMVWMARHPVRLSWGASLLAAMMAWAPLMAVYGWRSQQMASMGPKWGMVWVLAPSNEFLVSRLMAGVILSSILAGLFLIALSVVSYPWLSRAWVGRARQAVMGSATACLAIGFTSLLIWMGRSLALMGLAE